ncbi:MAG TPA: sugar ABC transporter permease [Pseudonocardiaceae bacterium]
MAGPLAAPLATSGGNEPDSGGRRGAQRPGRRRSRTAFDPFGHFGLGRTVRPWLLLTPALAVLAGLLLYPLVRVTLISLQDFSGLRAVARGTAEFIGLDNYREVLSDQQLYRTVLPNTIVVALACVVLTVVIGTLAALLLESMGPKGRAATTIAILSAWAVPAVTGTYIWIWIFDPVDGLVSKGAQWAGLVEAGGENWFLDRTSFFAIVVLNVVHHGFPFVALTVLAGLLTIPAEMVEAAKLDGAGAWRRFWSITVPTLKPVFAVVTILSTIWDFKVFTQVYLMPGGSGSNREVLNLGTWSYVESFGQTEYGTGSAIAVVLTVVLLLITGVYLRTLFKEGEL